MRHKIKKNRAIFTVIKYVININILKGLEKKKPNQKNVNKFNASEDRPSAELSAENTTFSFANTTNAVDGIRSRNPFHKSIIYDSGAAYHLTFEKSRFVGEITPASSEVWIGTPEKNMMLIHGYGTMIVRGTLNGRPRELRFANTAYVPDSEVTLVASNRLKEKGFLWNMYDDSLVIKETGEKICEIDENFGLLTLEFNAMPSD